MYDYVTQFLTRTNSSVTNCSLRDWLRDLIKNASKIFRFFLYSETYFPFKLMVRKIFQVFSSFRLLT